MLGDFLPEVPMRRALLSLLLGAALALPGLRAQAPSAAPVTADPAPLPGVDLFRLRSELLSTFWKKDMFVEAGVVRPLDWKEGERLPVAYNVHGFGGSHRVAWRLAPRLQEGMKAGTTPRMLYVYLHAHFEHGHHVFADSKFNGPWGKALTTEFIPALEARFSAAGEPAGRFLTGHSSGGWSTFWLQVTYPDFFGGCWSTAPDSVDFRDFTGIDIYTYKSAFEDPGGQPIMLMRREGKFVGSIKQYLDMELARQPIGG